MGKEQDLLDASRSGHLHIIEKILNARVKKSGPLNLTSLRRLPGPNTTDPRNGFTCLHYASLNGHKDIVRLLLEHGANSNVVDHNGSSPLHLASWTGDYEIVDMLISNNDLKAQINLKNKDNETALHSACQYGHTPVVSLLLTQGADPFIQNIRQETPLDLAAQYGRLETIELLLRLRFDLLNEFLPNSQQPNNTVNDDNNSQQGPPPIANHSPLHLASRNGHKTIVKLLLDLGFNVDYLTINGTALHEAVLCGKNEVVRLLLEAGTDVQLTNDKGQKVEELLDGLNTSVAKQTKKLIREHLQTMTTRSTSAAGTSFSSISFSRNSNITNSNANHQNSGLISPTSESLESSVTIAASNHNDSYAEDLTIVDSMLNEDILLYHHHPHQSHGGDDLLGDDDLMDDTDVQCISPPPGYTDNPDDDVDRLEVPGDGEDDHIILDCVSPSSSLFSTSIFSELASIFEDHLQQRNPVDNSGKQQQENHYQIKSSNSFTMTSDLNHRTGFNNGNNRYLSSNDNNNNIDDMQQHHQSFTDVYRQNHSPNRRMTTPNLLMSSSSGMSSPHSTNNDQQKHQTNMLSTSLNSENGELRKYFNNNQHDNDNSMYNISSSNYSLSSNASSMNNAQQKTSRPPKPPRKSIDQQNSNSTNQIIKNVSLDSANMNDNRCDNNGKKTMVPLASGSNNKSSTESSNGNGSSDLADSSDHSCSQHVNSVISNDCKQKKLRQEQMAKKFQPTLPEGKSQELNQEVKDSDCKMTATNTTNSLITSGHSIDDFYMLYDQAAREEYDKGKRDFHSNFIYQSGKHSTSMDLLDSQKDDHPLPEDNYKNKKSTKAVKSIEASINNGSKHNNDPPSPHSAETEIIHAIQPLKQQFYHQQPTAVEGAEDVDDDEKENNNSVIEAKQYKKRKKKHHQQTSNKNHQGICQHREQIKRDNWTLTDEVKTEVNCIIEQHSKQNMKSIGISVQFDDPTIHNKNNRSSKLIVECGREGEELEQPPAPQRRKKHGHHRSSSQQQAMKQPMVNQEQEKYNHVHNNKQQPNKSINNDYFSAYCETLKFDRKGEKENPFAGLCRGGLTPAKTNPNNQHRHQPSTNHQQQQNGTMEKKKKMVELSEQRKSLRKQRSILSGRAESLTKLSKLSVYNNGGGEDIGGNSSEPSEQTNSKSIDQHHSNTANNGGGSARNSAIITQPNNIYATLRKKKKSKSLNGDHHLTSSLSVTNDIGSTNGKNNGDDNSLGNHSMVGSGLMDQNQQIFLWLKEIHMHNYKDILIQNGYDDLDFMDNNVMDDNDLIEIGIIQASHRELILKAAQQLPYRTPKLTKDEIQTLSVAQWLQQIHLKQYVDIFHNNGLIELKKIRNIWEVELETMLEIGKAGHRRRILYSLSDFNSRDSIVSDNSDAFSPWMTDNASTCTNLERDREQVAADVSTASATTTTTATTWNKGWKHARHELVNGSCQYLVSYLGSTLVRELRGIDSTRASIGKLKNSPSTNVSCDGVNAHGNEQSQILKILLSISCQGVQFKDPKSNKLICEHEIRNIHCICQDSEDLTYFAYITKDFESNNHYCHVFMSTQTDLVTEIILTLGQAFEIAYQIVLEQYNIHAKHRDTNNKMDHQTNNNVGYYSSSSENRCNNNYGSSATNGGSGAGGNNIDNAITDVKNNNVSNNSSKNETKSSSSNSTASKNVDTCYSNENNSVIINIVKNKTTKENGDDRLHTPPTPSPTSPPAAAAAAAEDTTIIRRQHLPTNETSTTATKIINDQIIDRQHNNSVTNDQKQMISTKRSSKISEIVLHGGFEPNLKQDEQQQEQLYAVVDKGRKTKKPCLDGGGNPPSSKDKENRPVPPVRSSSTTSSNSSGTGTAGRSLNESQNVQQQNIIKPKPPVRVQSMQSHHHPQTMLQQKPEVSPKPKNLPMLSKSNTVTSCSSPSLFPVQNNQQTNFQNKPVLARFCAYQQQVQQQPPPPPPSSKHHSNNDKTLSSNTNSLPQPTSTSLSTFTNHHHLNTQQYTRKF